MRVAVGMLCSWPSEGPHRPRAPALSMQLQPPRPERWQQSQVWHQVCGVGSLAAEALLVGLGWEGLDAGPRTTAG